jgi:hypothetical protein
VLATDFSAPMLERARAHGGRIEYRLADAADQTALLALGEPASFDAVVCNMAIMDMAEIEPMVAASSRLLKRGGRFVFSELHPAFNGAAARIVEQSENERRVVRTYSIKVSSYIHPSTGLGVAIEGQPVVQWYFHCPISELFGVWFRHGFVLDGIEEPVLAQKDVRPGSTAGVFVEVPPSSPRGCDCQTRTSRRYIDSANSSGRPSGPGGPRTRSPRICPICRSDKFVNPTRRRATASATRSPASLCPTDLAEGPSTRRPVL